MLTDLEIDKIKNYVKVNPIVGIDDIHLKLISNHLRELNKGDIVLELGTWMGGSISILARNFPDLKFHTVDLCDPDLWYNFYAKSPSSQLFKFLKNIDLLSKIEPIDIIEIQKAHIEGLSNIKTYVGDSLSVDITDISVLIVDSDHREEWIIKELEYYYPKMKKKSYIFGDDYIAGSVKSAFEQFSEKYNLILKPYGNMGIIKITP